MDTAKDHMLIVNNMFIIMQVVQCDFFPFTYALSCSCKKVFKYEGPDWCRDPLYVIGKHYHCCNDMKQSTKVPVSVSQ